MKITNYIPENPRAAQLTSARGKITKSDLAISSVSVDSGRLPMMAEPLTVVPNLNA